jgi:uncharacterized phage protein (TIGR02218 family)
MSPGLTTFLNGLGPTSQLFVADLLTIAPVGGAPIVRLTSAPVNVLSTSLHGATLNVSPPTLDATVYTFLGGGSDAGHVTFTRGRVVTKIGLEVLPMQLILAIPSGAQIGGASWQAQAASGYLDGAAITLERAYMPSWGDTSRGTIIIEKGFTGELRPSRSTLELAIKPALALLLHVMPRRHFQPGCTHILYDVGCALSQAAFTVNGTAAAGSTATAIRSNLTQADHYFELGAIQFTSGANNRLQRRVTAFANANGLVTVVPAFPAAPANGDTFTIYPGCDKSLATCINKFNNLSHFAGFPFVPVAETTL